MIDQQILELETVCRRVRGHIVSEITGAGVGHIRGSLSMVETLVTLYFSVMNIDPRNPQMPGLEEWFQRFA